LIVKFTQKTISRYLVLSSLFFTAKYYTVTKKAKYFTFQLNNKIFNNIFTLQKKSL